jgi:Tfp pilus assembly protein PilV
MKFVLWRRPQRGFALVATLSLMILLTLIAVGLLSLSAVSLRAGSQGSAMATARANARIALMQAIGELQKQAGPDQRVSAAADLTGAAGNPAWTGVWRADQVDSKPAWLVSGDKPDPADALTDDLTSVALLAAIKDRPDAKELRVPLVKIAQSNAGGFGWWVGDEGVKARVDLAKPRDEPASDRVRLARAQSTLESGLLALGNGFEQLGPDSTIDKAVLVSMKTVDFATTQRDLPRRYFADLTTGGYGLPVNVALGRLKTDLSLLFDRSQEGKNHPKDYLGATGNKALPSQTYSVSSPQKFFLSDAIRTRVATGTGPNWGSLWNYARLWKNLSNQQLPLIPSSPVVGTDVRVSDWPPYRKIGAGTPYAEDIQHTNSPVTPVVSLLQIGFRLKTRLIAEDRYQLQMQVKPVVGIWNPYNVPIKATKYIFDWGVFPWLRYGSGISTGGQVALPADTDPTGDTAAVVEVWMREQWKLVENKDIKGKTRLTMETELVDLQPGEFRLFSVSASTDMSARNKLKSAWNEEGAYVTDLIKANGSPAVLTGKLPNGTPRYLWIGDMFLDDLQKDKPSAYGPATRARFPDVLEDNSTQGFFTFKATNDNGSLARYSDVWNTGKGTPFAVPERILSGAISSTVTKKAKYKVTDLALPGGYEHLATWSFFLRTTTQMEDVNTDQRLRGWVDSNPRALAINPRWEGAVAPDGKRQGWSLTAALMGGAHGTGLPASIVGDGGFGNRGLVAEASEGGENIEPQLGSVARYQGLGGASITQVGGQPNVMIYDVPRSPLVSIGQFQHAQLGRYSFEPGFTVGNSYADLKIPLDATVAKDFNGFTGHDVSDISYEVNQRLWDDFYFSTLGLDYQGTSGSSFDSVFKYAQKAFPLSNPRMWFVPATADQSIDSLINSAGNKVPELISSRVRISGAFNINSTSKTAWKAVLASMGASELPRIDPTNPAAPVWENPKGIRFNRFGHVATAEGFRKQDDGADPAFWLGWRDLDAEELDQLAEQIVNEVKARGPFRSLAEFVNRNPSASNVEHRRKGALQAAIDRTVNAGLPASVSDQPAQKPSGPFSDATNGENQAVGHAGYLMQGDVLQSLGPILQARSDYFRIRAYGEARDAAGKVLAKAWCEAFVQRSAAYVDPADTPETRLEALTAPSNKTFGRRYDIVSFRWLAPGEI